MLNVKKTLTKILNAIGICEQRKLLWTNSGESTFAGQTVPLNMVGYDIVEIHYYESSTSGRRYDRSYRLKRGNAGILRDLSNAPTGSLTSYLQRTVTVSDSGVTFGNGEWRPINSTNALGTGNDALVPIAIYGIKLVGGVLLKGIIPSPCRKVVGVC